MKRKITALLFALTLVFMLTACNSNTSTDTTDKNSNPAGNSSLEQNEATATQNIDSSVQNGIESSPAESSTKQNSTTNKKPVPSSGVLTTFKTENNKPSSSKQPEQNTKIDMASAKKTALNHAGVSASGISGYKIEIDRDHGTVYYEIEFRVGTDKFEYHIDYENGKILEAQKNDRNILEIADKISEATAKKIALNHSGLKENNITHYRIEFDVDDGVPSYEIEFRSNGYEYEYDINATSGAIIKSEKDRD